MEFIFRLYVNILPPGDLDSGEDEFLEVCEVSLPDLFSYILNNVYLK